MPATAVDRIAKLRRAYFALCRELKLGEEGRHRFNERWTGKPSTKLFSLRDWNQVVGRLQQLNGQGATPGRPRLRSDPSPRLGDEPLGFEFATAPQVETIEGLAARIVWAKGPQFFVRARVLVPLRQGTWDGAWKHLSRDEATAVILALQKMARRP